MKPIVIIGGGVTGLMAARTLQELGKKSGCRPEILLFERETTLGGKVFTRYHQDCVIEEGPDALSFTKPNALQLIHDLNLAHEIITPLRSGYSVLHQGRLCPVPGGILSSFRKQSKAVIQTSAISWRAKFRAALGSTLPCQNGFDDRSIAAFTRARWGNEFSRVIAEPLLAGIHGGDSERLSMKALYPDLYRKKESKTKGKNPQKKSSSPFFSLSGGLGTLVKAMAEDLHDVHIERGVEIRQVKRQGPGNLSIHLQNGETLSASHCILALPAFRSAQLLAEDFSPLTEKLSGFSFAPVAIVNIALPIQNSRFIQSGSGFLAVQDEPYVLSACTWSSLKWAGRAPSQLLLIRCFLGGPQSSSFVMGSNIAELAAAAVENLSSILGISLSPQFSITRIWRHALPQYEMGHIARISALEELAQHYPEIILAGASYRGSSVPDCLKDGKRAAERIYTGHQPAMFSP